MAYRQKYYYPNMAQLVKKWDLSCEQRIKELWNENTLTVRAFQNPHEHITGPHDATQIDLVAELLASGGYENVVTATDVFSRW